MSALSWESFEIGSLKPFYEASDISNLSDQISFFTSLPSHRWKLFEIVKINSAKEGNRQAIEALMGGCDGIIFDLEEPLNEDTLLNDIDTSICDISILSEQHKVIANYMSPENTVREEKLAPSPVKQISWILRNIADKSHVHRFSFPDFFLEIATLRSLRFLLNNDENRGHIEIHSQTSVNENPEYQWFLNTTAALASILGGSHSISVTTITGDPRISRNVGNLIRDESKITEYSDQCGGSYYLENLTAQIVELVKAEIK